MQQLKVGMIMEGKVTKITKFGVFVEIKKGITGLVHISEISQSFVVDISKILKFGETVKVKILSVENNKLSLSIKQANDFNQKKEEKSSKNDTKISFEDMLAKFKKNSEEKMSDIKKNLENKRSSYSKRR